MNETSTSTKPLIQACRGDSVPYVPVWFMRQAGRYNPRHRTLFEEHGVRGITTHPERNARAVLIAVEDLGVDGAVMYADILLPLEDMGVGFEYGPGDTGPIFDQPVRTPEDVRSMRELDPQRGVPYILEAIEIVRSRLEDNHPKVTLIGFSGGPFSLAGYMIEGEASRTFPHTKAFMHSEPEAFHELMDLLTRSIIRYLKEQVRSGIEVAQLFESWMGALSPTDYREYVDPYIKRIFNALSDEPVPTVFFGTGSAALLPEQADSGADVLGVDWRVSLSRVAEEIGTDHPVMGNLDPGLLLGSFEHVKKETRRCLEEGRVFPGHVFNLGHRVPSNASVDVLKDLVDFVHRESRR